MSHLEPIDEIHVKCVECGEEENIKHVDGAIWKCFNCGDTFSDGSDSDCGDYDHPH